MLFSITYSLNGASSGCYFIFSALPDILTLYLDLVLFCSFYFTLILIVYNCFSFFSSSFKQSSAQKLGRFLNGFAAAVVGSFFLVNNIVLPAASTFFLFCSLNYNNFSPYSVFFEANLLDFVLFYKNFYKVVFGFIGLYLVLFIVVLTEKFLKGHLIKLRRFFYCFFLLFATALTPPEVWSQVSAFGSLLFLFEISIFKLILKR